MGALNGTATDTLNGMQVLDEQDQIRKQQEEFLAQQAQAAQAAAQQSQQSYQQLAQAPPPQLSPADTFLPTLIGNIASTIAQDPGYRQRAETGIQQSRASLLKQRADNLTSQRDVFQQQAEEAKAAGDLAAREKYHNKIASLDKQLELVLANQARADKQDAATLAHQREQDNIRLRAAEARTTKTVEDQAALAESFDSELKTTPGGKTYLPLTNIKGVKATTAARQWAAKNGYPLVPQNTDAMIDKLHVAKQNNEDMIASLRNFAPKNWKDFGTMAKNQAAEMTGSDPEIATYKNYFDALIQQLTALAGGQGSGLRINQAEIVRQIKIAPSIRTPLPVAEAWAKRTQRLIDNAEQPVLGRAKSQPQAIGGGGKVGEPSQADKDYVKSLGIK
jgi:hypothetical protein